MSKTYSINTYLTKIFEIRDQIKYIGDNFLDVDLVTISFNGLPISWEKFIQSIYGHEKLLKFDRLWFDCVQEETITLSRENLQKPIEEEEEQYFASHARKWKGKF